MGWPRVSAGKGAHCERHHGANAGTARPAPTRAPARAGRYAAYIFWLMFFINFLNYLDRWIFTGLSPVIQQDLKLNDFEIGLVSSSAFLLVYTLVAMPLGFLADRIRRRKVVASGVAIWSLATVFTGLVRAFPPLLLIRTVLGIGEGSYYPAGTPLLAAYYPPSRRASVMGQWSVGALIGAAVGFLLAAPFSTVDAWRYAFFFTGVPGLIFALLIWRTRDKIRHEEDPPADHLPGEQPSVWSRLRSYLRIRTVRVLIAVHALGFFALATVTTYLAIYLSHTYGSTLSKYTHAGISAGLVPILAGAVVLVGGILGNLAGGALANRLSKRYSGARVLAGALGFLLAAPFVLVAIGAPYVLNQIPSYTSASEGTQVTIGVAIFAVFALIRRLLPQRLQWSAERGPAGRGPGERARRGGRCGTCVRAPLRRCLCRRGGGRAGGLLGHRLVASRLVWRSCLRVRLCWCLGRRRHLGQPLLRARRGQSRHHRR